MARIPLRFPSHPNLTPNVDELVVPHYRHLGLGKYLQGVADAVIFAPGNSPGVYMPVPENVLHDETSPVESPRFNHSIR